MKNVNLKKSVLAVAVVLASGYMGVAAAHSFTGTVANNSTEVMHFQCFTDTNGSSGVPSTAAAGRVHLELVSGVVNAELAHIQMITPTNQDWAGEIGTSTIGAIVNLTPPAGKTAGIWSSKGYVLAVTNTSGSSQVFDVTYHCETAANVETGTGDMILNGTADPTVDYTLMINN